jgi:O-antigen ligase
MTTLREAIAPSRGLIAECFPGARDSVTAMRFKDGFAIAFAIMLPWSTTATAALSMLFLASLMPSLDWRALRDAVKLPASLTALLLVALGVVGMVWAVDVPWADRLRSAGQLSKLLAIPFLLYHFQKSERGLWVILGFFASCCILLVWSWLSWIFPEHVRVFSQSTAWQGVPIKNYITQSQEFTLCAFALAGVACRLSEAKKWLYAALASLLAIAFVADMIFVVSARTALVYIAALLVLFALRHLRLRAILILLVGVVAFAAVAWSTSSFLRMRVSNVAIEYQQYMANGEMTSTGERLTYWRKAAKFIAEAPVFGHGSGATRQLFQKDAVGQTGYEAVVVDNPHNQTLHAAIQWGLLGCILLYAMWITHLRLFLRNDLWSWIGLTAVVENITSSLLNSHIVDFVEGWLYVMAVGVLGGMVLKKKAAGAIDRPEGKPSP